MRKKDLKALASLLIILILGSSIYFIKFKDKPILNRNSIKIIEELTSPNGKNKAIVYLDNGSTTVAENIRVALIKSKKKSAYESDVVFLQNNSNSIKVEWSDDNNLLIKYEDNINSEILKYKTKYNKINILSKKQG
ncbi:MAG: DUF5412 family protein [Clostridium saudiense]|nr:DUF5412 family protein [Clostridium saudiense]